MQSPRISWSCCLLLAVVTVVMGAARDASSYEQMPSFAALKAHYPGYAHHGGKWHNHRLVQHIGCDTDLLLKDTSALRLSVALNAIGGPHSLGRELIRLSTFGRDSVAGSSGLQHVYHPIAYGPYLADKYGYPTVSKLHDLDPADAKKKFWGRQGVLRVITYTHINNSPKGHVALWDCDHFHQAKDWIKGHDLITVEFWESPDSDCSRHASAPPTPPTAALLLPKLRPDAHAAPLRHHHWEKRLLTKYFHKNGRTYAHLSFAPALNNHAQQKHNVGRDVVLGASNNNIDDSSRRDNVVSDVRNELIRQRSGSVAGSGSHRRASLKRRGSTINRSHNTHNAPRNST